MFVTKLCPAPDVSSRQYVDESFISGMPKIGAGKLDNRQCGLEKKILLPDRPPDKRLYVGKIFNPARTDCRRRLTVASMIERRTPAPATPDTRQYVADKFLSGALYTKFCPAPAST